MTDIAAIQSTSASDTAATNAAAVLASRNASGTGAANDSTDRDLSFDDFIDMVNPLQHIPVASSIYRAITGEHINPVSRIAGDALYGGVFGLASAGLSMMGAAADEAVASMTGGRSASDMVVAALFGRDADAAGDGAVMVASAAGDNAANTAAATQTATTAEADPQTQSLQVAAVSTPALQTPLLQTPLLQTAARQSPILDMPAVSAAPLAPVMTQVASVPATAATAANTANAADTANATDTAALAAVAANTGPAAAAAASAAALAQGGIDPGGTATGTIGMPLDRSKMAYGGVMDSAMVDKAMQNQSLALAMASGHDTLQEQRSIRSNRFATTTANTVTNTTAQSASLPLPGDSSMAAMVNPAARGRQTMGSQTMGSQTLIDPTKALTASQPVTASQIVPQSSLGAAAAGALSQSTAQGAASPGLMSSLPQAGKQALAPIKGLDQYRATAQRFPATGSTVDVSN